jgi:hypothetical protein
MDDDHWLAYNDDDDEDRAVPDGGSGCWCGQSRTATPAFDFPGYFAFPEKHPHNFTRL